MENIVISIGGSVILSDDIANNYFQKLKKTLEKLGNNYKFYIVVGGGKTAREYIKFARKMNFNEDFLDEIGIDITRINAKILSNYLGLSEIDIPKTTDIAKSISKPIVVMGGTIPGHSTDMVGAELAEKTNAEKFIIATNVDGVYDKDPNRYDNAKLITEISIDDLIKKYGTEWDSAGKNIVIDGPALKIINDAKIQTYVINGKEINQLENVILNKDYKGTVIKK